MWCGVALVVGHKELPHTKSLLFSWRALQQQWQHCCVAHKLCHRQEVCRFLPAEQNAPDCCTLSCHGLSPLLESESGYGSAIDSWPKGLGFGTPARSVGEFSSSGSTFCADSHWVICSSPMLRQLHVKGPGHSAKNAGGRFQPRAHASYRCGFE